MSNAPSATLFLRGDMSYRCPRMYGNFWLTGLDLKLSIIPISISYSRVKGA